MTAKSNTAKPLVALRDFTDAGTERRFKQGEPVDVDTGALANYEAAGLVGEKTDLPAAPADTVAA